MFSDLIFTFLFFNHILEFFIKHLFVFLAFNIYKVTMGVRKIFFEAFFIVLLLHRPQQVSFILHANCILPFKIDLCISLLVFDIFDILYLFLYMLYVLFFFLLSVDFIEELFFLMIIDLFLIFLKKLYLIIFSWL